MSETGAIKFTAERSARTLDRCPALRELNIYRTQLRALGLIGIDRNGIGFGNISIRDDRSDGFFVTGSGTGGESTILLKHCAKVVAYDFARNWLQFEGIGVPSAESLTHAAIYEAEPRTGAVIHGHHLPLWAGLIETGPATPPDVEYGTPDMAQAVQHLFHTTNVAQTRAFAMAGHREGIIAFGHNLAEAYDALQRIMAVAPAP